MLSIFFIPPRLIITLGYDLYAKKEKNDSWTYLGNGFVGTLDSNIKNTSFDLKSLDSAKYFRIIYQTNYYKSKPKSIDDVIGIDALKSLNK